MTDDHVVRFGLVIALVGILVVALVFIGEAVRPTPILYTHSGTLPPPSYRAPTAVPAP